MSIKNKKSIQVEPPKEDQDFYIKIPKDKLIELDNFLQQVPHGIAMQIVSFMKQFDRIPS